MNGKRRRRPSIPQLPPSSLAGIIIITLLLLYTSTSFAYISCAQKHLQCRNIRGVWTNHDRILSPLCASSSNNSNNNNEDEEDSSNKSKKKKKKNNDKENSKNILNLINPYNAGKSLR